MPSFSITPARITEPAVGAWVWASGSHVCSGKIGTLTANAMAKAKNSHRAVDGGEVGVLGDLDEVERQLADARRWRGTTVAMMPTSMNAEPNIVNRKNFSRRVDAGRRSPSRR